MKIRILETSDMHGFVLASNYTERQMNLPFGMTKVRSVMRKIEEEATKDDIILKVDNGDILQGSALAYYMAKQSSNGVVDLTAVTNSFDYDLGLLGNHEFNYGIDYLKDYVANVDYPILAANVLDKENKPAFGQAYKIIEKKGVKIAVLGLLTQYIPHWEQPKTIKGLTFKSIVETAKKYLPQLREEADVVIVAYHGGFERNLETGEPEEALTGENEGYQLLKECGQWIDAFVTGHQHREIAQSVLGVPSVQPGYRGANLAEIVLELYENKNIIDSETRLHPVGDFAEDAEVLSLISPVSNRAEDWLDQTMGRVSGDMRITNPMQVRVMEHPYIEFINKVQMESSGAKISGTALFNNEAKGFQESISMRDILTNYIYPNTLTVLRVTGEDLRGALEMSATYLFLDDEGRIVFNPKFINPKPQYYNYDMYEGIEYTIDLAQAEGSRIVELSFEGQPVEPEQELEIVVNQYRGVGGGNYSMFDKSKIVSEITVDMTELIGEYLEKHPVIEATSNQNFKVLQALKD
ncbi:bifunctional metallophosphatase/5'-nucleotidase [Lactococcus ileimucosae]|uniref:bifunctional metallophosphatase/5'-nucleotidase n=1 Tax=Lactococcus ileimucosae TaxID=2941329 RepID=UPI00204467F5|nr:bifunctional metallophosphatase/5'-nucleotidase [Lactococcus ileimucosae]